MNTNYTKIINITLSLAVIFTGAVLARTILVSGYVPAGSAQVSSKVESNGVKALKLSTYAGILSSGLYAPPTKLTALGRAGLDSPVQVKSDSLDSVKLVGTITGEPGFAIFMDSKSRKQEIFKTGDTVFNVGRLTSLDWNTATITQDGKEYKLQMPKDPSYADQSGRAGQRDGRNSSASRNRSRAYSGRAGAYQKNRIARRTGDNEWIIEKRALDEALSDMGKILTQAGILPYRVKGKTKGFRLSSVQPTGVFGLIGLRSGDILLKVNNYAIDSPQKGIQLLSGLRGESQIKLDILRAGKPKKLNYEIR